MANNVPIKYLPSAEQDVTEIFEYILIDYPSAAASFISQLDERVSILSVFPESGHLPNDPRLKNLNYRILVLGNYLVFMYLRITKLRSERFYMARENMIFCFDLLIFWISPNVSRIHELP